MGSLVGLSDGYNEVNTEGSFIGESIGRENGIGNDVTSTHGGERTIFIPLIWIVNLSPITYNMIRCRYPCSYLIQ